MFDIGFSELLLCAVLALLVLGPERLPSAARTAGRWAGRARRFMQQMSAELDRQIDTEAVRETVRKESDEMGLREVQASVREALSDIGDRYPTMLPLEVDPRVQAALKGSAQPEAALPEASKS